MRLMPLSPIRKFEPRLKVGSRRVAPAERSAVNTSSPIAAGRFIAEHREHEKQQRGDERGQKNEQPAHERLNLPLQRTGSRHASV